MGNLSFLSGAVFGLAMSSALWFGLTILWDAATSRVPGNEGVPGLAERSAIGLLFVAAALLPVFVMCSDESWSALRGYGVGAAGMSLLVFIELVRASK